MPKRWAQSAPSVSGALSTRPTDRRPRRARGKTATILMLASAMALQSAPSASAATLFWDTASGSWQAAGNWTTDSTGSTGVGSAIPGSADTVFFNGSAINGAETITLSAATAAAGITFTNTGTTLIDSASTATQTLTLGTGGLTINPGAGAVTIGNASNVTNVALTGGAETWTNNGTLTLVNGLSLGANPLIFAGTGVTNLNGVISGTVATGTTTLTIGTGSTVNIGGTVNSFTGDILVNGGTLSSSMNGGTSSPLGGQIGTTFRTMTLQNGGTYVQNVSYNDNAPTSTTVGIVFNIGTGGGTLSVASGMTLTLDDGTTAGTASTGQELQGTGALTKSGLGTLLLRNASLFTGSITVAAGTLQADAASGVLGTTAGATSVLSGGAFDLFGFTVTDTDVITITGAGLTASPKGAITNSSGTAAGYAGNVVLSGDSTIGAAAAGAITLSGAVTGTGNLTISNASTGGTTFSGASVNNAGTITNNGTGTGTTTIAAIGANVTGIIQSGASPLTITGAYSGTQLGNTISSSGAGLYTITGGISAGNNLVFNATSTGGITVGGTATATGTLTNSGTGSGTTTIAAIGAGVTGVVQSGASPLTITGAYSGTQLGNTVSNSGTGLFTINGGISSGTNLVFNASNTGGITIGGTATATGSLTNSGTGTGTTTITALGAGITSVAETNVSPLTINSAVTPTFFAASTTYTGTGLLTLAGGISAATANLTFTAANTAPLSVGAINTTGTITNLSTNVVTITGVIAATVSGITQNSTGSLSLQGANLYTGPTSITAGTLIINNAATSLGASTAISLSGGTLSAGAGVSNATANITHVVTVGASGGTININAGTGQLYFNAANLLIGSGPLLVTGTGALVTNAGNFRLAQTNSYSGPITITAGGSVEYGFAGAVAAAATFNIGNQGELVVNSGVTLPNAITVSGGTNSVLGFENGTSGTFSGPITLNTNAVVGLRDWFGYATARSGIISGSISGVGGLSLTSGTSVTNGTLTISSNNNTYSGGTVVNNGNLTVTGFSSVGTGAVTVAGNGVLTVSSFAGLGSVALNQTGGTVNQTVANAFAGGVTLNLSGGTTNLSLPNAYNGGAPVNISGTNVTNVGAANALPGPITMTGGTLSSSVTAAGTYANASPFTVGGGVLTSAVAGGNFQNVTVNAGSTLNPGGVGSIGTGPLTLNNLAAASGVILQFDIGTPSSTDLLSLTGTYSFGSGTLLDFAAVGTPPNAAGNYKLIQYSGAAPTLSNFILPAAPSGEAYSLDTTSDPGFVDLVVSGALSNPTSNWTQTGTPGPFSWNATGNWTGGVIPHLTGDIANFNTALTGPQSVTVDGQQRIGGLVLNPTTAFAYTLNTGTAGSVLLLDNGASAASILNSAQNNVIAANLTLISSNTNVTVSGTSNLTLSGTINGTGRLTLAAGSTGTLTMAGTGAYTGGTEIDAGTLAITVANGTASQINNAGSGITTLNGGTLSFTATTGTTTAPAGFALVIGPNGGTLNVSGAGTAGKLTTTAQPANWLSGSGTLTKTGGGDWQTNIANILFTGNINMNGLVEVQNVAALGFGTTTGYTGGTITVGAAGEIVTGGQQIFAPINLNGGILSANGNNNGIFNNTVTVTAPSTLRASQFQTPTSAQNFAVGTLAGTSNLTIGGSTTANGIGLVSLGNASGYTGTITIGANAALGIGNSTGSNFFGNSNAISVSQVTSGIGLLADGDGFGTPQTIAFTLPSNAITFVAGNTTGYLVGKQGATVLSNTEANKTIRLTTALPYNNTNTLNVQPLNGYGLQLTAQPALVATTTFGVGTVGSVGQVAPTGQASNVVAGLSLTNLTGGFGIVKSGVGTLQLGLTATDASDTFGFAASTPAAIDITGGILSAFSNTNLGAAGNGVRLSSTTLAEFLALGTFTTGRTITLNTATGDTIGVSGGNTLTLSTGLAYASAGNVLNKVENGTLLLTAAATGAPISATTISAGALQISASNSIGSGTITVANSVGAALQITGNGTFTQALSLSNYGIAGNGALEVVSGSPTWATGVITMANAGTIGVDQVGSTLTISSSITATGAVGFVGAGNITVGTALTGAGTVTQYGSGVLTFNATGTSYGNLSVNNGTVKLAGTATAGVGTTNANFGGILTVDDTGTNTPNRLLAHSYSSVGGSTFNLVGTNNATSADGFFSFAPGRGQTSIIPMPTGTGQANLTLTSTGTLTRTPYETVVFGTGSVTLGTAPAAGAATINTGPGTVAAGFQGAGTVAGSANYGILPYAIVNNNGTISLATSTIIGANGFLRNLAASETTNSFVNLVNANSTSSSNTLGTTAASTTLTTNSNLSASLFIGESVSGTNIPAGAFITAISGNTITLNVAGTLAATNVLLTFGTTGTNVNLTSAATGPGGTVGTVGTLAQTINSLTLGTGGSLTLANSNQVLTIANTTLGGAILSLDLAATISGGQLTGGVNELVIHTPSNLTISSNIVGGAGSTNAGVTKADGGTLTLSGTAFVAGQTSINSGTVVLNAGNNTFQYTNLVTLGAGATLNLNGNSQIVTDLLTDATAVAGLGTIGTTTANVTGTAPSSTVVINATTTARNYTGTITGGLSLVHSGSQTGTWTGNESYTGSTLINGGGITLMNGGQFSATSSLNINRAALTFDNTGSIDMASRVSSGLPISLAGGTLSYLGRGQFTSLETLGAVNAGESANTISVTNNTAGLSSAQLTLTSLTRALGATVNFTNTNGTLGTIGSNPQIFIGGTATTPQSGVGSILGGGFVVNGTDFAGYNTSFGVGALGTTGFAGYSPLLINNAASSDNVTQGSTSGVNLNSQTINSLRITGTTAINFNTAQTLTLASGGLLINGSLTLGSAVNQGNLTSGGSELFLYVNAGTSTINSAITGSGVALVKSGPGTTITVAGTNTYDNGTYVDQGTLVLANAGNVTTGLSTLGTGGIFLNGGTLTQTVGGVIPAQAVTISGNGALSVISSLAPANSVTTLGSNLIIVTNTNGIAVGQLVTGTGIPGNEFVTAVNPANNTVTITSGSGVTAGTNALTFVVNNTFTNLTFNNNGGTTAPTLTVAGVLNLPNGSIAASSNNVGTTSIITGGNVDFGNVANPTITVNPITFNGQNIAPLQATLNIASVIQNSSNPILVTGGGNLQLGGASTFMGGVNLAGGTSLTIAGTSTNSAGGQPLSGPLGTGTLTIGTGSTLYADTTGRSVGNNIVVSGNFSFDATSSAAAALTLGAGGQTIALPAGVATTVTVNAPQMTGILNDTITGNGSTLIKAGLGTLQLNNNLGGGSNFSGGVILNAGTLLATGVNDGTTSLGSGAVTINGGVLQLHHNGNGNNAFITYGNNVNINSSLANAYIDVNNNGSNTGNTILMGTLDYGTVAGTTFTSTVAGNPAPTTLLNITGGNGYKLQFNGTTLTNSTSSATFNVGAGLFLILPGGFTVGSNLPTNIGPGTLSYSGSNSGVTATSPITGTVTVSPASGGSSTPLGTGAITLNSGSTLQISPILGTLSATGYSTGGVTAKYYYSNVGGPLNAVNYGIAPNSTLAGVAINDGALRMSPFGVNNNSPAQNTLITYQGLLNIATGGTYFFGAGTDDSIQVVVDGQTLQSLSGGQALNQIALQSINLASGTHMIVVREANGTGGGGDYVYYSGPDTSSTGPTGTPPVSSLVTLPLSALAYATNYTLANRYQNAAILNNAITIQAGGSATIDGLGTDFNYAIPSLTLGAGATLVAANGAATAFSSTGNGAFIVTGNTNVSAGTATLNQTTGTLVLAGGVTDSGNGLTKTGQGNLILGASSAFTGPLNINGGFVQLADPAGLSTGTTTIGIALTTPATLDLNGQVVSTTGNIILNGGAGPAARTSNTPAGLYNSSAALASLPTGGNLFIGAPQTTGAVNATIGGFGDINILGTIQDLASAPGSALNKVGPDTLILSNSNTFTGIFNITGGMVQITGSNGFTSNASAAVIQTGGTTIDLNGQTVTTAKPLTLNGTGLTGLGIPNQLGALINSTATPASYAGNITLAGATTIGGPSLTVASGGITLSGTVTGNQQVTAVGNSSLTLTNGSNAISLIDIQEGSVTISGAGKAGFTGAPIIRQGTTLTLDNSGTAVNSRWFNNGSYLTGNVIINGNSGTAVSEIVSVTGNNLNIGQANGTGQATITLNSLNTSSVTLQVATTSTSIFNRGAGSTALLRGDGLGTGTTAASANTAYLLGGTTALGLGQTNTQSVGQAGQWNAPNALIYQWAVADASATGVGTGFAGYSTYGGSLNFGTANTGGVAPINIDSNNALAAAPTLTALNVNTTNASTTVTTASTTGLAVGQLVTGSAAAGIPANAVITAITNGTTFTISANATVTGNNTLVVYANPTTTFSNVTTTASTTVTVASTANLYVGEVVSGTSAAGAATGFIPSGDTILSITDATHFVLTTAATAGANPVLTFSLPGYANIASSSATNAVGSTIAAQEQNSITLSASVPSTLTITKGLQLDSGAVLAVGNADNTTATSYTIGGTGWLTGTNTLNREMIFHVTGAANTLTVNAPIFSNGGGLTKADGGTLVLGTAEIYTGLTSLNGGITKLAGGTNTIFTVFTTAPSPGNANAAPSGQSLFVNYGATLDLNGNNQAVSNLTSGSGIQLAGGTIINSSGTATLHIAPNGNQTFAGNISNAGAGVLNLVRDGNNTETFNSPNTLSGTVTLTGGATTLQDLGTFQNASAINVTRSTLIWNDQGTQSLANRLSPTAPINLAGGGLQFLTRDATGSAPTASIQLGTLNLGVGESDILISSVGQGAQASVTFAGIGTRAAGATLNIGGAGLSAGNNPNYYFAAAPTLVNGIIGGWATVNSLVATVGGTNAGFATYDPASGVRVLQYQPSATYGPGVNLGLTATATFPGATNTATTTTVNSLSIYNATTLSFTNAFDTLLVQSGGILSGTDNNGKAIGTTATPGMIQSGAGNDLYIHTGSNTTTINSKIIDNGSNNNLVVDGLSTSGAVITLTNANTFGGTTYLSGATLTLNSLLGPALPHDVVLSGGNNGATDSLIDSATQLNFAQPNQLTSAANVTMNGASRFNLGSSVQASAVAPNTQTIATLTIKNDGGSNSGDGPTVFTGSGGLTISGALTSTNNAETFTIPTINGFLNLPTGNIVVDANQFVPNQIGLAINANIAAPSVTKTGLGYLGIGGQSQNLVGTAFNLNAGGLAFSTTTGTSGMILGSTVLMAADTTLDTRGLSGVVGSVASSSTSTVIMNGVQGTAGTLTTGLDNSNTSFAGILSSPYPTGLLNLTKIGKGTFSLTNDNTATNSGTLLVDDGGVLLAASGAKVSFTTTMIATGGTLTLDNTSAATSNRLGTSFLTITAATLAPTVRTVSLAGGNLTINGNSSTAISEGLGAVTTLAGSVLTLNATGTAGVNLSLESIAGQGAGTSLLIRGDNLGATIGTNNTGAGNATLRFATAGAVTTAPGLGSLTGGSGANNTFTRSIRADILVSASSTGLGDGFLVLDSVTGLVRSLNATTETQATPTLAVGYTLSSTTTAGTLVTVGSTAGMVIGQSVSGTNIPANDTIASIVDATHYNLSTAATAGTTVATYGILGTTQNVKTSANTPLFVNTTVNSVTLGSGGGFSSGVIAGNAWAANGTLLTLTATSNGFLSTAGDTTIAVGQIATGAIASDFHVLAGSTLTVNSLVNGAAGGLTKSDGGTLILNQAVATTPAQTVTINGGTLRLGGGANSLLYYINGSGAPSGESVAVNNGTLDLNGNSTALGALTSTNPLPFAGGTSASPNSIITNTSTTAATLTTNNTNSVLGTVISGNLNLDKAGNTTMSLSSPQTYMGTTTVRGGSLVLRDSGSIASTAAINLNYAELTLDNTGLSDSTTRISAAAPVNLTGGALRVNSTQSVTSENLGTVSLNGGANLFYINQYSNNANGSSPTFTIANLAQSNNATLNIVAPFSTSLGGFNAANAHVYLTQLNGTAFNASSMLNGIIAPWLLVSNTSNLVNWATYSNNAGLSIPNANSTPAYGALNGGIAVNANVTASTVSVAGQTLNTLALVNPGAATVLGLTTPADQLVLAAGGLLINDSQSKGISIAGGSITAGSVNVASTLYLHAFTNAATINSPIVNNGTGALSIIRDGNAALTLTPVTSESFTFAANAGATTTLTVPNASLLTVGMGVSGALIPSGTTISSINSNIITLSQSTTANGTTATPTQLLFTPPTSTAFGVTTAGSNTVSIAAASLPGGFTPVIGMTLGSSVNLPSGATITAVTLGTTDTFTLSAPATTSSTTAALVFNPANTTFNNTYTGTTTISAAVDQLAAGTTNLSGVAGSVLIQGNLVINGGATVSMVANQGQIASTSSITVNGSGVLNLLGTNTLSSVNFSNSGGSTAPTINSATLLNLTSATPISAVNDNTGATPTISGTAISLTSATGATIDVTGQSLNDLTISAQITSAGTITKTGSGSLILPNANGASLTWALSGGSIFVNAVGALGTNASAGALSLSGNVGLASANNTGNTISLPTIFIGPTNLSLGNAHANNQVTLAGAMNLNSMAPTFTVAAEQTVDTITGPITGGGGFTKAGPGALTLTPGATSTFTGAIIVSGGLLTVGNANAINTSTVTPGTNTAADVTVGTGAELNINAFPQSFGSLAGSSLSSGGIVTNSGAAAALTVGSGSNGTNATFGGALTAATQANLSLIKVGSNNQTLSGKSFYTGATTVSGGTLTLQNGSTAPATPTLNNTAITVASPATLAASAAGADVGTANTVNVGEAAGANAGATLTLSPGALTNAGGIFTMVDKTINTFNILGNLTGTVLTLGGAGTPTTNAPALKFEIGSTQGSVDQLTVSSGNALVGASGATISIASLAGATTLVPGNYTIVNLKGTGATGLGPTAAGPITLTTGTLTVAGRAYSLDLSPSTASQEIVKVSLASNATELYWRGNLSSAWNTKTAGNTNWAIDAAGSNGDAFQTPTDAPANVLFTVNAPPGATNVSTTLGADTTINSLTFTGTGTTAGESSITIGGTNVLTINAATLGINSAANGITVQAGSAAHTISAPLVLPNSQTWTVANGAASPLTISGSVTAATGVGLTKAGPGTLVLSGNNATTLAGPVAVTAGTLSVRADSALGSGAASNTLTLTNGGVLATTASFGIATSRGVLVGPVSAGGGTVDVAPGTSLIITGPISDASTSGSLTKSNTGSLSLAGNSTYSGGTTINAGTVLGNNATSSTGSGPVAINSGGTLGGTGTVSGRITLTSGGTLTGGTSTTDAAAAGTLALGTTTWDPAGTYVWKINNASGNTASVGSATPGQADQLRLGTALLTFTSPVAGAYNLSIIGASSLSTGVNGQPAEAQPSFYYEIITGTGGVAGLTGPDITSFFHITTDQPGLTQGNFKILIDDGMSHFALANTGTSVAGIDLVYTPTPEPVVTGILGLAALALTRRPRRQRRAIAEVKRA